MTFIPQFYSNSTTFPIDLIALPTPGVVASNSMDNNTMWGQDNNNNSFNFNFIPVHDNGALDHIVSQDWDTLSKAWMSNSSEQFGSASDLAAISECKLGFHGDINNAAAWFQNFNSGYQPPQIGEFEEDINPPSFPNSASENWGTQGNQIPAGEEPNIKVERYSEEERKERILRYLKKRNQRNFSKTIKYACRKTLADRRFRVRGRFARNNETEEDMARKMNENNHKKDFYGDYSIQYQVRNDDDWLQEAMASLVYLSHSSPDDI